MLINCHQKYTHFLHFYSFYIPGNFSSTRGAKKLNQEWSVPHYLCNSIYTLTHLDAVNTVQLII
jgi:hypothetical protein